MIENVKEILGRLVAYDTTISRDTLDAVNYIKKYLSDKGIESHLVYNTTKTRATLLATIGNPDNAGIILSGHLDVVAADANEWTTPPFSITENDGKLYGRGSVDMKGAIACVLALIDELKASGKTFHFAFTHDEEGGFTAIQQLIDTNFDNHFKTKPLGCIVMEPTMLVPICAHKGTNVAEISVQGKACHSAYPDLGIDAIAYLIKIYNFIQETFAQDVKIIEKDNDFSPASSTVTISKINGGDAPNKVPGSASFIFTSRNLPNKDMENFINKIKDYVKDIDSELKSMDKDGKATFASKLEFPAFHTDLNSNFIKDFYEKTNTTSNTKVSYGTEAGYIQSTGINTIIFGPGSIEQAHMKDEFIEIKQLESFLCFIKEKLCYFS